MDSALVLYIPVLHRGYLDLFQKYKGSDLYILGPDLIKEFFPLHEEIRALDPEIMKTLIMSLNTFKTVSILTPESIQELKNKKISTSKETVSRKFITHYFPEGEVTYEDIFLRWDEEGVKISHDVRSDRISSDPFDKEMIERANHESEKSSDWWRHVGAVLVKDKKVILDSHNRHVPSEHLPYIEGDPRDSIPAGKDPELATAMHAEQVIVVEAARQGISLEEAHLYLTNFPCTMCAKLVAYSGIKKVFFESGSAVLDGERVLKVNGVEIILVK